MKPSSYPKALRSVTDAQLQAFVHVAEYRSFTRAARQLEMTQSAVSHAVSALEKALGVDLLIRSARDVHLSAAGETIVRHAREVLKRKESMFREAQAVRNLREGVLRVGSFGPTSSRHLLPPILRAWSSRHPRVSVRVIEGSDQEIEQWLRKGDLDAGFVTLPNDEFETVTLARDEMVVLLAADAPLAKQARVKARQLASLPFIMSTGGCEPVILKLLEERLLDTRYQIREVQTIVDMVRQGLGISIKPSLSLPDDLPPGVVTRPLEPAQSRFVGLAWPDRGKPLPVVSAFVQLASEYERES